MMEDTMGLNGETKKEIEGAREEIKRGEFIELSEAKKKLGF